jgi:thiol:disulfide interchange protein
MMKMEKQKESRWKRLQKSNNKVMHALCMFQMFAGTAMIVIGALAYTQLQGKAVMEVDAALMAFLLFSLVGLFAISNASLHWKNVSKEES